MFAAGFLGWFVINWLVWREIGVNEGENFLFGILTLPVNLIVMVVLAAVRRTRWIGLGILTAIVLNLVITLVMGLVTQAVCLIPFFTK
jgi:hypothetical protein